MKRPIYLLAGLILCPYLLFSQLINFESDSYSISREEEEKLFEIHKTMFSQSDCRVYLKGHTDSKGSDNYNLNLSRKRAESVFKWFTKNGVDPEMVSIEFFGETQPVETAEIEKMALNRRVEINIKCPPKAQKEELNSVWELYKTFQKTSAPKSFTNKEGFHNKLEDGSLLFISANAFQEGADVKLKITAETFGNYHQMFLQRLTTLNQNGSLMESAGMYRVNITNDQGLNALLRDGEKIKIFIPANENSEGMAQYAAYDMENYIAWQAQSENGEKGLLMNPFSNMMCYARGTSNVSCPFFFCKIRNFFSPKKKARDPLFGGSGQCTNSNDLEIFYRLNAVKLSGKFPTYESFKEFAQRSTPDQLEKALIKLIPGIEKAMYMMMEINSYRPINCDRFVGSENLTQTVLDIDYSEKLDARLYFNDIKSVMPGYGNDKGKIVFPNVPVGLAVTLLIVKHVGDKILIAKEKFKIGEKVTPVFNDVETEALKDPGLFSIQEK